jgi:uncharacterized protein (TIGR03067 family)
MTRFRGLVAAVAAVLFVGGVWAQDKKPADPPKEEKKEPAKFDASKLEGKWTVTEMTKFGEKVDTKELKDPAVITKDTIKTKTSIGEFTFKYTLDTKADPVVIDMEITSEQFKGTKAKGIVKMDGDKVWLTYDSSPEAKAAPKDFESKKDSMVIALVMTKAKDDKKDEKKPTPGIDK